MGLRLLSEDSSFRPDKEGLDNAICFCQVMKES